MRLGVALLIPPPVDREVDVLRRACGAADVERVPPHCTLVPPVNVREDRLDGALAVLRTAASSARPFALGLGPPATFLPTNPVLFLAVGEGADAVRAVREAVFVEPLARTLTWPFVPHVTVLDGGDPGRIAAAAGALADYRAEVVVERVHLLQEQRVDGRRVWRPIADATFAAPAVVGRGGLELVLDVSEGLAPDVAAWASSAGAATTATGDDAGRARPLAVVARREGGVVGVANGATRGADAHLAGLVVAADARRQGVGGHVLAAFTAAVLDRGCDRLRVCTEAGGRAEAFYRRHGFVGGTPPPAGQGGRDVVPLERRLAPTRPSAPA